MIGRYFADAERAAAHAEAAAPLFERDYSIAGLTARLRFCGPALLPILTRAMTHIESPRSAAPPDLTVMLWDSATTGVDMPPPPWSTDDYVRRGEVRDFHDGAHFTAFSIRGTILALYNAETRRGLYWTRDARGVPAYERAAPCRAQMGWWLAQHGRQPVHAGAVGDRSGCVLLAGKGGSGKSNTAIAALAAGLSYLSDDYCVIGAESSPTVYSLYTTGKILDADLPRFPALAPHVSNPVRSGDDKAVFFFHEHLAPRLLRSAPLKAVLIPRVVGCGLTEVRPATATEALLAMAPSTTSLMPYAGAEVLRNLSRVVKAVPAFHLSLGTDGAPAPAVIESLLSSL